jgi:acyl-CoA:6-aminopenicillanic acid acyl transferase
MTRNGQDQLEPGFRRVRIGGGPFERGLQHGEQLRDGVRGLRDILYREVVDFHGRPLGCLLRAVMAPFLLAMHRHIPRSLRLEMRGVATGASVPYWDVLIFNCFDDLLHGLWLLPPLLAKVPFVGNRFACSSFALTSESTAHGELLHGRNLDYEVVNGYLASDGAVTRALKTNLVVLECEPSEGLPFLSVGWPGFVGAVTGVNRAGLSLACLTSTVNGETPNGLALPLLYRQILERAGSLDDAERLLRDTRRTIGNNLLIASAAEDDARVFELSPHGVAVRRTRNGRITTTNHFVHDEMTQHQNGWVFPSSVDRQARLEALCADGRHGPLEAGGFLLDTLSLAANSDPWSCLQNPGTIYSTIAEPASGRIWLRVNDRPEREFVEVAASWARQPASATV